MFSDLHEKLHEKNIFMEPMILYGVGLGFIIGIIVTIPVGLAISEAVVFLAPIIGLYVGFVFIPFFFFICLLNSWVMKWVTLKFFPDIKNSKRYKWSIGFATAIVTLTLFFIIPNIILMTHDIPLIASDENCDRIAFFRFCGGNSNRPILPPEPFYTAWLFSLMFPVYASIRTAQRYLILIGKDKVKGKSDDDEEDSTFLTEESTYPIKRA